MTALHDFRTIESKVQSVRSWKVEIIIIIINIFNLAYIMLIIARTTGIQTVVVMNGDNNTRVI